MEEDWEKMLDQDISDIQIQKKDEDNIIVNVKNDSSKDQKTIQQNKVEQIQPKQYQQKDNIFKGLSIQQKKILVTDKALKTEKQFKDLGKQLAEKLQEKGNQYGVYEFANELLMGLQLSLGTTENQDISNKIKVLTNDRIKQEKTEQKIKEKKEKEYIEQQIQLQLKQQQSQNQQQNETQDDDFM